MFRQTFASSSGLWNDVKPVAHTSNISFIFFEQSSLSSLHKKKRAYRKNRSLSRKKKRGTAKTVKLGAQKASFIRDKCLAPAAASLPTLAKPTTAQKVKSLTNALEYQRRRSSAASEASATLQQRICSLEDEVTAKDHQAGLRQMEIAHLEAAVERTKQTLERRTERWIAHNEKRDEYIIRMKKASAHRLAVLKRTHEEDMAAQEARQYRMQREMGKQVVRLESKLNAVETHARYVTNDSFFIHMVLI
jgi:hypothetical protein